MLNDECDLEETLEDVEYLIRLVEPVPRRSELSRAVRAQCSSALDELRRLREILEGGLTDVWPADDPRLAGCRMRLEVVEGEVAPILVSRAEPDASPPDSQQPLQRHSAPRSPAGIALGSGLVGMWIVAALGASVWGSWATFFAVAFVAWRSAVGPSPR